MYILRKLRRYNRIIQYRRYQTVKEVLKYFKGKTDDKIKPMKVKTTLYTGDEMPDYKVYPTIFASERWFTNFDKHLYNRIKEIKNSKIF